MFCQIKWVTVVQEKILQEPQVSNGFPRSCLTCPVMNSIPGDRLWPSSLEISACQNNEYFQIQKLITAESLCKNTLHWNNQIPLNIFLLKLQVNCNLQHIHAENGYIWKPSKYQGQQLDEGSCIKEVSAFFHLI